MAELRSDEQFQKWLLDTYGCDYHCCFNDLVFCWESAILAVADWQDRAGYPVKANEIRRFVGKK